MASVGVKNFSNGNICLQQPVADPQVDIFKKTVKWKELAPPPVCCTAHTAVLLGGNVYVGGGLKGRSHSMECHCGQNSIFIHYTYI